MVAGLLTALGPAAPALAATCQPPPRHRTLILVESADGPFTAIVTKTACPATISVAQGEGSYIAQP